MELILRGLCTSTQYIFLPSFTMCYPKMLFYLNNWTEDRWIFIPVRSVKAKVSQHFISNAQKMGT